MPSLTLFSVVPCKFLPFLPFQSSSSRTSADGNCLYNSASLFLVGDESLSTVLRILTCSELFLHAAFYSNHPYLKSQSESFESSNTALTMALSDKSTPFYGDKDHKNSVKGEALHMSRNGISSSLMCILGLSSVLRRRISSYFPPSTKPELDNIMNGDIDQRGGASFDGALHLLWNAMYHKGSKDFKPNHFVPLNPKVLVSSFSLSRSKVHFSNARVVSKEAEVDFVAYLRIILYF